MLASVVAVAAVTGPVAAAAASGAQTTPTGSTSGSTNGHGVIVGVDASGSPAAGGSAVGTWRCTYRLASGFVGLFPFGAGPTLSRSQLVAGQPYWRRCVNRVTGAVSMRRITAQAARPPTAQRAQKEAPLPEIGMSPDAMTGTVVGIPTWIWVRNFTQTDPLILTNGLVGVVARLVPMYVVWDLGDDGTTPSDADVVRCDGAGVPWTPRAAAGGDGCAYVFRHRGPHHVTATIWWDVPYFDTVTGQLQHLPPVSSTSAVDIVATELDTVIRDR